MANANNSRWWRLGVLAVCGAAACGAGSCALGTAVGFLAESARRQGSTLFPAEYTGLREKSFAVVVTADRVIMADHTPVIARVTNDVAARLAEFAGGSAFVPGPDVLQYTYSHPRWSMRPLGQLATDLGVQRLVIIDLTEYRLSDPGNQYLWAGVATVTVRVIEADSPVPDEPVFTKQIQVKFPTKSGYGPLDIPRAAVNTELTRRLVDRCAWLFYDHEESNIIEY